MVLKVDNVSRTAINFPSSKIYWTEVYPPNKFGGTKKASRPLQDDWLKIGVRYSSK